MGVWGQALSPRLRISVAELSEKFSKSRENLGTAALDRRALTPGAGDRYTAGNRIAFADRIDAPGTSKFKNLAHVAA